jgi:thiol-disulfide isomerase/thioredoxin
MKKWILPLFVLLVGIATHATLGAADVASTKYHFSLLGDSPELFDASGKTVVPKYILKQKYLVLYFSASWCGPCHQFNPEFIAWYKANGGGKDFEVILVGQDDDTAAIKKYMKDEAFPWIAFEKKGKQFEAIEKKYGGKGIPCVVVLDEKDEVVAHSFKGDQYLGPKAPLEKLLQLEKGK